MRPLFAVATFALFASDVLALTCTTNQALKVAEAIAGQATPFCSTYLNAVHTNVAGIPQKLASYASIAAEASSVCSCLLHTIAATTTTTTAQPTTTTTQPSLVTCPASCSLTNTKTVTSLSTITSNGAPATCSQTTKTITSTATITSGASPTTCSSATTITSISTSVSTVTSTVSPTLGNSATATCTLVSPPPPQASCDFNGLYGGVPMFQLSAAGNTASSLSQCAQQCLSQSQCQSFSFDGTDCTLYTQNVLTLELNGVAFPVDVGVAGSIPYYDASCFNCGCMCAAPASKRDLSRREAVAHRREAELERREAELSRLTLALE